MPDGILDRELAAASRCINELRDSIRHAPQLGWFQKLAGRLVRGGPSRQNPADVAKPYLAECEHILSQVTMPIRISNSFKEVETVLDLLNHEILADSSPFSPREGEKQFFDENPGIGVLVALALSLDKQNPIAESNLNAIRMTFSALKLYKQALDSAALQDKRDELLPDFLREAQSWDSVSLKIEIRKRREQLSKVQEAELLPKLALFTSANVSLPQIFARQQRFITDLISDLEERQHSGNTDQTVNRKEEVNAKIRECERELRTIQADNQMDETSKRKRVNIISKKIDSLYEELEGLY